MIDDLRYAARSLSRNPGFTAATVGLLALAIGANTAVFSVANGVLLRPLPLAESERLVAIWESKPQAGRSREHVSPPTFLDWRTQSDAFEGMSAFTFGSEVYADGGSPEQVPGMAVSGNFFSLLRVRAVVGRTFTAEDEGWGREKVIVLSHGFWKRSFAADPGVVGRSITLGGESVRVLGVLAEDFRFVQRADFWLPLEFAPDTLGPSFRGARYLRVIARLKPGVTVAMARARMGELARRIGEQHPNNRDWGVVLVRLREDLSGDLRRPLLVLMAAAGMVLLIACGNVGGLLLSRAAARRPQTALRAALGASGWRLARQSLAEGSLLAAAGAGVGVLLAIASLGPLLKLVPTTLPRAEDIRLDASVLAFALLASVLVAVLVSVAPALGLAERGLMTTLRVSEAGSPAGGAGLRWRRVYVVLQISLSVVLLTAAGLLVGSFVRLRSVDPGFQAEKAAVLPLQLPETGYPGHRERVAFARRLLDDVRSLPGVERAALATNAPLGGTRMTFAYLLGDTRSPGEESRPAEYHTVSPDYFRTLGVALLEGRDFVQRDDENAPAVVIVSRALAKRHWPHESPLGKRIRTISRGITLREIVGVVGDVKHSRLAEQNQAQLYVPFEQDSSPYVTLAVRAAAPAPGLSATLRRRVWSLDKTLPVGELERMDRRVDASIAGNRFQALVAALFAGLALLLATVGLFALVSQLAGRRTREVGIRKALGARSLDVLLLLVGEGLRMTVIGIALGLLAALGLTRWLSSLLFAVSPSDPATLAGAAVVLLAGSVIASYIPARRAAKLDPMEALRCE